MWLFSFFNKPIMVNDEDLFENILYAYPKRKTRKVKLNKELVLKENQLCVFCYGRRAYDTFSNPNTYQINANSLPQLFKNAGYNKPNKKGKLPSKYSFSLFFTNTGTKYHSFILKNIIFKDSVYGKNKCTFSFNINFNITNLTAFTYELLDLSRGRLTNKNSKRILDRFFSKFIRKYISKHKFTLGDIMHYTNMINEEITKELKDKMFSCGIELLHIKITDLALKADLEQTIIANKMLPSNIQKEIDKKQSFSITKDGVPLNVTFTVPEHFSHNNLAKKYALKNVGIIESKDEAEYKITTLAGNVDSNGEPIDNKQVKVGKYCLYCHKLIPTDSAYCPYCSKET